MEPCAFFGNSFPFVPLDVLCRMHDVAFAPVSSAAPGPRPGNAPALPLGESSGRMPNGATGPCKPEVGVE
jgi:hypothetical protein